MSYISRILAICILGISTHVSAEPFFNFSASTPEGSWALREIKTIDHKGRQTVVVVKQKYLGSVQRQGQTYYWLETEMDNYRIKKDKRKPEGEHTVLKVLVSKEAMSSDPANVVNNLHGFGKEIIMQSGDSPPMMMNEGGLLAGTFLKSMGIEINYQFKVEGSETIDTDAGAFKAKRITGSGSTSSKILFKKMEVKSRSIMWVSDKVPFGVVKGESSDTVNGKESQSQTRLLEFARSGAVTAITGEPKKMPF